MVGMQYMHTPPTLPSSCINNIRSPWNLVSNFDFTGTPMIIFDMDSTAKIPKDALHCIDSGIDVSDCSLKSDSNTETGVMLQENRSIDIDHSIVAHNNSKTVHSSVSFSQSDIVESISDLQESNENSFHWSSI